MLFNCQEEKMKNKNIFQIQNAEFGMRNVGSATQFRKLPVASRQQIADSR
jgi:hypothetical protein